MGVNLRDIVTPREIRMEALRGNAIAIDALNTMFQFLSIIRDRFTGEPLRDSKGRVTSHLSGLFYRTARMLESGITPVFVFDGPAPEFKRGVQNERRRMREEAKAKLEQAVKEGDTEKIRLYSQQTAEMTEDMLDEAKRLLDAMGVQWIRGPTEGEAEAAYLNRNGTVYACASQDWDSLLFGAKRLIRNLTITGKRKLPNKETHVSVSPHMIELEKVLSSLGINHDQLIIVGILTGTDYNPGGVKGLGPKKALELVRQHRTLDGTMGHVSWDFEISAEKIFEFFRNPPVEDMRIEKRQPDPEKVRKMLMEDHDFSEERIGSTLEKLQGAMEEKRQSSLQKFF